MFSNGKSILVQPIQRDDLILNQIDGRLIDIQQKITDLLSAGYTIYDVASATNSNFNNLIASSSGNRICVWKSAGSTAYTLYSTELASNGTNVIVNATINNMNQVTAIRDCQLTCSASSGLFANKAEFFGGDWYLASWTTGSNVKFSYANVNAYTSEIYLPNVNFEYCNVNFKRSGTIAYSTYKENIDTRFVNETTAGSTASTLTLSYAYTTDSDWFTRCTLVDWQNTGTAVLSSTELRTFNFNGLKTENSNLAIASLYTTEGSKIYYEGQDLVFSGSVTQSTWQQIGSTNVSSSSGLYPSLAFNQSGIAYLAYQDDSTGSVEKASCMKYGSTGWQAVGYTAFSTGTLSNISLCISTANDIVVVGKTSGNKAEAYYFSAAASSWNLLGSANFSTNNVNLIDACFLQGGTFVHVITTNTSIFPYIDGYYISVASTSWNHQTFSYSGSHGISSSKMSIPNGLCVAKYGQTLTINASSNIDVFFTTPTLPTYLEFNSNNHTTLSNISYIDNHSINTGSYEYLCSLVNSSNLYVFGGSYTTSITYYGGSLSTGTVKYPSINVLNGIPYVAIQDTTAKATVYKWVAANSSWNLLGGAQFSTDNINRTSLNSDGTNLHLAVEEKASPGIALYKFGEISAESNVNYSFENLESDIYDGEKALDITTIQSTANYILQNCKVQPGYNIVDTVVGRFIRNTYNISLAPGWNPPVDDLLKETNADTFWIVKREDIEGTLDGMIIKNLKLYDSGLNLYDYKSNDNFIIIANNVTKGNAVFCFYNNKVKGTEFSDWFLDTSYTITDCFILMEVNEIADLQNIVPSTALADCPLEAGNITFNSYDNEVVG